MRLKLLCLICVIIGVVTAEVAQGPPGHSEQESSSDRRTVATEKSESNERKAGESAATTSDDDDDEEMDEEKTLEAMLQEELGIQGTIKVIRPELEHDRDKVADILSTLVTSHAMLIKKFETEIKEIDGSLAAIKTEEEEPPKAPTPDEIEAENLYETAMKIMNRTRSDKSAGFAVLQEAASKGHIQAQAEVAWGQLMGNPVDIDIEAAKATFERLADDGLPDAHMVCGYN